MDPEVIKAAATSPLGILALLILVVSALATKFFDKAPMAVKVLIFLLIFTATCGFGYTVVNTGKSALTTSAVASLSTVAAAPPDAIVPASSTRSLTQADLAGLSKAKLKIARNEIYARHGYVFKTDDMKNYFGKLPWYKPTTAQVSLSPTEAANVETIRRAEAVQ